MTQLTKRFFGQETLIVLMAIFFLCCRQNTVAAKQEIAPEKEQNSTTAKIEETLMPSPGATDSDRVSWYFLKSVPVSNEPGAAACSNEKISSMDFSIKEDSVFISGLFTDKVYSGNVKSKGYFKQQYRLNFYSSMLLKEFRLKLGDEVSYIRNASAYQEDSRLNSYFNEAFFLNGYMFAEVGGCVYVFVKEKPKAAQKKKAENGSSLKAFYASAGNIDLPLKYSFELVQLEKGFIPVPENDFPIFGLEQKAGLKIARLPVYQDLRPVLLIAYDESGQSSMYLVILNSLYTLLDRMLIYTSEETETGSIFTSFSIDKEYGITVTKAATEGNGNSVSKKKLSEEKYHISQSGKFEK